MDITVGPKISKLRDHLQRGRLLNADQLRWLRSIDFDPSTIARLERDALLNARTRIEAGKRLNSDALEAVQMLDTSLRDLYDTKRRKLRTASSPVAPAEVPPMDPPPQRLPKIQPRAPKSTRQRVAEHTARESDIGPIPSVRNPVRRAQCERNLALFGELYCSSMLLHPPSEHIRRFISAIEDALLNGGKVHVRFPRGKGKTTWIKIATLWSLAYGHRRFVVVVAATLEKAKQILKSIYRTIRNDDTFAEDFPEISHPIRELNDTPQRAASQHIDGHKTAIVLPGQRLRLPNVPGSPSCGSVVVAYGCGGSIRGESEDALRPDMVLCDDPQKRSDATSIIRTDEFEDFLVQDVYGLAGHNKQISVLMASTPVAVNDGSSRFADADRHPEMSTLEIPLIVRMPERMDLWDEFAERFRQDQIAHSVDKNAPWTSRAFYDAHREEMDRGAETIDPLDGDPTFESSALHHAFILRAQMGPAAFDAEYQMIVRRAEQLINLTPSFVSQRLNNFPPLTVPIACRECVAFCDVNARADVGLRWGIVAIGRNNVASVIAYGRYPTQGRLYPEKATDQQIDNAVARGLAYVTKHIADLPITRNGGRKQIHAFAIDAGWRTAAVHAFVSSFRAPFKLIATKGFGWRHYNPSDKVAPIGNNCHLAEGSHGTFLAFHADYWREYMQRAFMAEPLQAGSLSLFGADPKIHATLAEEVCAEALTDTGLTDAGRPMWVWTRRSPENHFGDVLASALTVASWYRLLADPQTIARASALEVFRENKSSTHKTKQQRAAASPRKRFGRAFRPGT